MITEDIHFLSIGCNAALATSASLASQLAGVLRRGFIWACDFGEQSLGYLLSRGLSRAFETRGRGLKFVQKCMEH